MFESNIDGSSSHGDDMGCYVISGLTASGGDVSCILIEVINLKFKLNN